MKEIKDDINYGNTPHVHGLADLRCQYYTKLSTYLYNPTKIPMTFLAEIQTHALNLYRIPRESHILISNYQYKAKIIRTCGTAINTGIQTSGWPFPSPRVFPTQGLNLACPALLSIGFSRQEYWSGLPSPSPGDLPNPGIKPRTPALQEDSLSSKPQGSPWNRLESPKTMPCIYDQIIFLTRVLRQFCIFKKSS